MENHTGLRPEHHLDGGVAGAILRFGERGALTYSVSDFRLLKHIPLDILSSFGLQLIGLEKGAVILVQPTRSTFTKPRRAITDDQTAKFFMMCCASRGAKT